MRRVAENARDARVVRGIGDRASPNEGYIPEADRRGEEGEAGGVYGKGSVRKGECTERGVGKEAKGFLLACVRSRRGLLLFTGELSSVRGRGN